MIYIETRINEYYAIERYLRKLFPGIRIFQAKLTKEMVDFGFSADNPYVIGLNMTRDEFNNMLLELEYVSLDEEIDGVDGYDKSPTKAAWLHSELSQGKLFEKANGKEWRFSVVGNIVKTHEDDEGNVYYGTKAFKGGTKVFLDGKYFSPEETKISVIGMNRYGKYAIETVPVEYIENVRFQVIYNMTVMRIMDSVEEIDGWVWWGRTANDKREAKEFVKNWYLRKEAKANEETI